LDFKNLFKLRGELPSSTNFILGVIGFVLLIVLWWILAEVFAIERPLVEYNKELPSSLDMSEDNQARIDSIARADSIAFANATEFEKVYPLLPRPDKVIKSFKPLFNEDDVLFHTVKSIWLNLQGYLWAILIAIPLGFLIGLYPIFSGLFSKQSDAMRFLPLTALTGLFVIWFGIEDRMKIAFLAFGIIVYLLPVVTQRVRETSDVYTKTVFTLGATDWQTIKTVFIPSVMSKVMDDIRVLTAISWTYIIIAELLNRADGIGALIYIKARLGQIEKVFAILIIIILIGFLQDKIFSYIEKRLLPHKQNSMLMPGVKESQYGIYTILFFLFLTVLLGAIFNLSSISWWFILPVILISGLIIIFFGEWKIFKSKAAHA